MKCFGSAFTLSRVGVFGAPHEAIVWSLRTSVLVSHQQLLVVDLFEILRRQGAAVIAASSHFGEAHQHSIPKCLPLLLDLLFVCTQAYVRLSLARCQSTCMPFLFLGNASLPSRTAIKHLVLRSAYAVNQGDVRIVKNSHRAKIISTYFNCCLISSKNCDLVESLDCHQFGLCAGAFIFIQKRQVGA